jgi:hypothetical protein
MSPKHTQDQDPGGGDDAMDDDGDDDDDDAASRDSFSTAGSDDLATSPHQQGYNIGANLRGLMEKRISFSKTNSFTRVQPTHRGVLPTGADPRHVLTLADMQQRVQREGSSADNSLVNPDDSVSMVQSAARTRHSNLPEGTRALDSLSAYEVALLLHSLELGRYVEGLDLTLGSNPHTLALTLNLPLNTDLDPTPTPTPTTAPNQVRGGLHGAAYPRRRPRDSHGRRPAGGGHGHRTAPPRTPRAGDRTTSTRRPVQPAC